MFYVDREVYFAHHSEPPKSFKIKNMKKTIQKLKRLGAFDSKELAEDIQEAISEIALTATLQKIETYIKECAKNNKQ